MRLWAGIVDLATAGQEQPSCLDCWKKQPEIKCIDLLCEMNITMVLLDIVTNVMSCYTK
jgi:hypothetical protein